MLLLIRDKIILVLFEDCKCNNHVFRNIDPTRAMKRCLEQEIGLPYVNFKSIGDYVVLMCYYMKLLGITKTEIKAFIRDFERITDEYRNSVKQSVTTIVIRSDLSHRMAILKNYI